MIAIISTTYFEFNEQMINSKFIIKEKFWWKNVLIQRIKTRTNHILVVTCGYGKANAAMALTYIIEKFPSLKAIINIDIALSTNNKLKTGDVVLGKNFIYHDSDLTIFEDIKFGQILNEPDHYSFDNNSLSRKFSKLKMGFKTGVIGTADNLIYNSKQLKDLVEKFGYSIDVIDTEAGVFAQIASKSNIDFLAMKIVFNNALSSWETDPLKQLRIDEATNKLKFIILKILILLSTRMHVVFKDSTDEQMDIYIDLMYYFKDKWIKMFAKNIDKLVFDKSPMLFLFNKKNIVSGSIELINVDDRVVTNNFLENYVQEYRSESAFWNERMQYLGYLNVNKDDILFNKSTRNKPQSKRFTIEDYAKLISKKVQEECLKKEKISYRGVVLSNRNLIVTLKINPSFYMVNTKDKKIIQDKNVAVPLLKNEFLKFFKKYLGNVESPYKKIMIFLKIPYGNRQFSKILLFNTVNKIDQKIKFKESKIPKKYKNISFVDILRNDNNHSKVGDININLNIK